MSTSDITTEIPYGYCHCGCGQKTKIARKNRSKYGQVKGEPLRYINLHHGGFVQTQSVAERFWSKVAITANPDKCWGWQAGCRTGGYGSFQLNGKNVRSNRYAYQLAHGSIPDGLFVLHTCDNQKCCNPAHLFLGTHQDNMRDMHKKGRGKKGNITGTNKLTPNQVLYIREQYATGKVTFTKLARQMNICRSSISAIINGKHWKHVR